MITTRRLLAALSGAVLGFAVLIGLSPAVSARPDPDPPSVPVNPPTDTVTTTAGSSGLPLWAVLAIVVGAIVLAVATTLITLAVRRGRGAQPAHAASS